MTRPRAYQINAPRTNYVKHDYEYANSLSNPLVLSGSDYTNLLNDTVTGVVGGSEIASPAKLFSNANPAASSDKFIGVAINDNFSITDSSINNGNPIIVTFISSDIIVPSSGPSYTTAAIVAKRINATISAIVPGVTVAYNDNGVLRIETVGVGPISVLTLKETLNTNTVLTKLNFAIYTLSVMASGLNATRGLITKSTDEKGGTTQFRWFDGSLALTESSAFTTVYSSINTYFYSSTVGGQSIYTRLLANIVTSPPVTPNIALYFSTYGVLPPTVISNGGNFENNKYSGSDLLSATVTFVDGISVTFSLIGGGYTPSGITEFVGTVNTNWENAVGLTSITNSIAEPYLLGNNDYITINGYTISFTGSIENWSASEVKNIINAQVTGIATLFNNNIRLTKSGGLTIGGDSDTLNKLGLVAGSYIGGEQAIAFVYGSTELKLMAPSTSVISITLIGNPVTFTSIGIPCPSGTLIIHPTVGETQLDYIPTLSGLTSSASFLLPEHLEMGDIPQIEDSTIEFFTNKIATSNIDTGLCGSTPTLGINGKIKSTEIDSNFNTINTSNISVHGSNDIITPYTTYSYSNISGTAAAFIAEFVPTPVSSSNTEFRQYIISSFTPESWVTKASRYVYGWNAGCTGVTGPYPTAYAVWHSDVSTADSLVLDVTGDEFAIRWMGVTSNSWTDGQWTNNIAIFKGESTLNAANSELTLSGTIINDTKASLTLSDVNIAGSAAQTMPLSGGTAINGDGFLRLGENDPSSYPQLAGYSLLKNINSKYYVSVGDGVSTFGDFNGTTAIADAVTYCISIGVASFTIYVKPGTYISTSTININSQSVSIIGSGVNNCVIKSSGVGPVINFSGGLFNIEGVKVISSNVSISGSYAIKSSSYVNAKNCIFYGVWFYGETSGSSTFTNCHLFGTGMPYDSVINFTSINANIGNYIFDNCTVTGYSDNTCVYMQAKYGGYTGNANFGNMLFNNCIFNLANDSYATSSPYGHWAVNTGLICLDPNGTDTRNDNGLIVNKVKYENCTINAGNIILHLVPTQNGVACVDYNGTSPQFVYVDQFEFNNCNISCVLQNNSIGHFQPFIISLGARKVDVINCKFDISGTTYVYTNNQITVSAVYGFLPITSGRSGTYGTDTEGCIAISSDIININGCEVSGFTVFSGAPDITLVYTKECNLKGSIINSYSTTVTSGNNSSRRFFIYDTERVSQFQLFPNTSTSYAYPNLNIEDVIFDGWSTDPFTISGSLNIFDICAFNNSNVCIDNIRINTHASTDVTITAINLVNDPSLSSTNRNQNKFVTTDCSINKTQNGIVANGWDDTSTLTVVPGYCWLSNSILMTGNNTYCSGPPGYGIWVSYDAIQSLTINSNHVSNGQIKLVYRAYQGNDSYTQSGTNIVGNTVACGTMIVPVSISVSFDVRAKYTLLSTTSYTIPILFIYNNITYTPGGDISSINVSSAEISFVGGATSVSIDTSGGDSRTRGAWPYYGAETATGSTNTTFWYTTTNPMLLNYAKLESLNP